MVSFKIEPVILTPATFGSNKSNVYNIILKKLKTHSNHISDTFLKSLFFLI